MIAELKTNSRENWRTVRFGDVVRNVNSSVKDALEQGIERFVGLEHLDPESLLVKRWGNVADGTSFTRKFESGQVLFGKRRAYQRKAAVADFDGICSGDILVFEPKTDELLPELLPFVVQSDGFFEHALGTSAGSLSPRTKWSDLARYEFVLPPKDEQQRIAEILLAADETLNKFYSALNRHIEFSETLMEMLFVLNTIPEHWQMRKMSEIADVAYGISEAVANKTDPSIGCPILTGANITLNGQIDLTKLNYIKEPTKESFILKKGDLLLNWRSGSSEHVGKTAIFDLEGLITYASFILRIRPNESVNNIFLHRLLNFMKRQNLFGGATNQQVNFKMNAAMFRDVLVIVPPLPEQLEMVEKFRELESAQDKIESHIFTLKKLKSNLLKKYVQ